MAATDTPPTAFYDSGYSGENPAVPSEVEAVTAALEAMVEALISQRSVLDAQIAAAKLLRDSLPSCLVSGPVWQG